LLVQRLFKDSGSHHARSELVLLCSEQLDPLVLLHPRAVVSIPKVSLTSLQGLQSFSQNAYSKRRAFCSLFLGTTFEVDSWLRPSQFFCLQYLLSSKKAILTVSFASAESLVGSDCRSEFSGPFEKDRFCLAWPRDCALVSVGLGSTRNIWSAALTTGKPSSDVSPVLAYPQLRFGEEAGV